MTSQMGGQGGREPADAWGSGADVPGSEGAPPLPPKTSGLARASLLCGMIAVFTCALTTTMGFRISEAGDLCLVFVILALLTSGVTGILGLMLGTAALVKTSRRRDSLRGRGFAVGGTILSGAVVATCIVLATIGIRTAVDRWNQFACGGNLSLMSDCLAVYEARHDDEMPAGLEGLFPEYVTDVRFFRCRGDKKPVIIGQNIKCSYHYVGRLSPDVDRRVIVICEDAGHHRDLRNVVYADNHLESLHEDEFWMELKQSLELVKQADWDSYSPERQAEIEAFYQGRPLR